MRPAYWFHLQEIDQNWQSSTVIRCIGVVLRVIPNPQLVSFLISDSTATAEATLYETAQTYQQLSLPRVGDSIVVRGTALLKELGRGAHLIKIRLQRWSVVELEEEMQLANLILIERRRRMEYASSTKIKMRQPNTVMRALTDSERTLVRQLIFTVIHGILESNYDLMSYIFSPSMIRMHREGKAFARQLRLSEKCFTSVLEEQMETLLHYQMVSEKQKDGNSQIFYVMKRGVFDQFRKAVQKVLNEKNGLMVNALLGRMQAELGVLTENRYLFSTEFLQVILQKMSDTNKIYKTATKEIFINHV